MYLNHFFNEMGLKSEPKISCQKGAFFSVFGAILLLFSPEISSKMAFWLEHFQKLCAEMAFRCKYIPHSCTTSFFEPCRGTREYHRMPYEGGISSVFFPIVGLRSGHLKAILRGAFLVQRNK